MAEGEYKTGLTGRIYRRFHSRIDLQVVRLDAGLRQGIPDMLVLFQDGFWAALEAKMSMNARRQPNQPYYVAKFDNLCFAAFICPENEEAVLHALEERLAAHWATRPS